MSGPPGCGTEKAVHSVVVVSSFRLLREAVRALIEGDPAFHVIAESDGNSHTLRAVADLRPDLILFDLDPNYAASIETMRELIRNLPAVRVIAFSQYTEDTIVESALRTGVWGFLSKAGPSQELAGVLQLVAEGDVYLSPRIAARVMDWVKKREVASTPNPTLKGLTKREIELLRLVGEGKTSKEAAVALDLAVESVRTYRKSLMKKLNVHNVAGLLRLAASAGLIRITSATEPE